MAAVAAHGIPLVDHPDRVGMVEELGIDETSFLRANRSHPTVYATGLVDTAAGILIDLVEANTAADLREWCQRQPAAWLAGVQTVSIDLTDSYRSGLSPHLDHAVRVADPFHVVRVGNRCLDTVRRRVQRETQGHRGRRDDPLYRIRKLLLTGSERLDENGRSRMLLGLRVGDPADEVAGAWLAKESVRDVYLVDDPADAATLLDKAIAGCLTDEVAEIQALGRTLSRWRTEILNHHTTGASTGTTEGLNLVIKKVKRAGHGFRRFGSGEESSTRSGDILGTPTASLPCRRSQPAG
jgi:transposase